LRRPCQTASAMCCHVVGSLAAQFSEHWWAWRKFPARSGQPQQSLVSHRRPKRPKEAVQTWPGQLQTEPRCSLGLRRTRLPCGALCERSRTSLTFFKLRIRRSFGCGPGSMPSGRHFPQDYSDPVAAARFPTARLLSGHHGSYAGFAGMLMRTRCSRAVNTDAPRENVSGSAMLSRADASNTPARCSATVTPSSFSSNGCPSTRPVVW